MFTRPSGTAITMPEDKEEIDMHYAEQVWAKKAKEEGILIGPLFKYIRQLAIIHIDLIT